MSTPDADAAAPAQVPVCYRHPDRETYIRCTRCERPICPDCMTSASVGFQCPECVAEGAASIRPVRTRLGAKAPSRPYVTYAIIALCVVVFGLQQILGSQKTAANWASVPIFIAEFDQYYRLITSTFMHGSFFHLLFNMLVLWMLGRELESQLGHIRFVCLYLLAGLGGSVASFWFSAPFLEVAPGVYQPIPSLGASGAVFGLMGAYLVIGRFLSLDVSQVFGLLVINVLLGFVWPNTDWRAHLGGLATGALVAALFAYAPRRQRVLAETAGLVGILALLVLLTLVRDSQLTQELDRLGIRPAASSAQAGGPTGVQATVQ